jgi:diketogulonate reductase-like aldo/keto reductase
MRAAVVKSIDSLYGGLRDSLDVALLHTTTCWTGHCTPEQQRYPWLSAWRNLEELHALGMVKAIGVSNVNAQQLMNLIHSANVRVSVVQNWMDPLHQDIEVGGALLRHFLLKRTY